MLRLGVSVPPLNSGVMPERAIALSSFLAALFMVAVIFAIVGYDVATDDSGMAYDAARGVVALPFIFPLIWAITYALGRAQSRSIPITYRKALGLTLLCSSALLVIPLGISVWYGLQPLTSLSALTPWLLGVVVLSSLLAPGIVLQTWMLRRSATPSGHNNSLQRQ